jgi:uncharacterized protein (TIGR03067 family)
MKRFRLFALAILTFPSASLFAGEADDLKKLSGVWKGWVVEGRGDDPKQRRIAIQLTIKDNTIIAIEDGKKDLGEGTFTIKHSRDGKQLDATRTKGPGSKSGATYLGIYSLDGDTLKWCVGNPPGKARPDELRSKTGQFLMVLTRGKEK